MGATVFRPTSYRALESESLNSSGTYVRSTCLECQPFAQRRMEAQAA